MLHYSNTKDYFMNTEDLAQYKMDDHKFIHFG